MTTRRGFLVAAAAVWAIGCALGCTNGGEIDVTRVEDAATPVVTTRTFVGDLQGTDARFGLVVEGGKGFLFFCGGDQTFATATKWFRGALSLDAPFALQQTGWTASAGLEADGHGVVGTLDRGDGAPLTFRGTEVAAGTDAGLYEATDTDGVAALIVKQASPSDAATMQGAFKGTGGSVRQVVPLGRAPEGFQVQATIDTGVKSFVVKRAHPK